MKNLPKWAKALITVATAVIVFVLLLWGYKSYIGHVGLAQLVLDIIIAVTGLVGGWYAKKFYDEKIAE